MEDESKVTIAMIAIGATLVTLAICTATFIYKNKKLYFEKPEAEMNVEVKEIELEENGEANIE